MQGNAAKSPRNEGFLTRVLTRFQDPFLFSNPLDNRQVQMTCDKRSEIRLGDEIRRMVVR